MYMFAKKGNRSNRIINYICYIASSYNFKNSKGIQRKNSYYKQNLVRELKLFCTCYEAFIIIWRLL